MKKEDIDQIVDIENSCFSAPWSPQDFENELQKEYGIDLVAEYKQSIEGYAIGWMIRDDIHIANVAVHPQFRLKGIGEQLIRALIEYSKDFNVAVLEVRCSNHTAQRLYKKLGFKEIGIRDNYYEEEGEDAVLMFKQLNEK